MSISGMGNSQQPYETKGTKHPEKLEEAQKAFDMKSGASNSWNGLLTQVYSNLGNNQISAAMSDIHQMLAMVTGSSANDQQIKSILNQALVLLGQGRPYDAEQWLQGLAPLSPPT